MGWKSLKSKLGKRKGKLKLRAAIPVVKVPFPVKDVKERTRQALADFQGHVSDDISQTQKNLGYRAMATVEWAKAEHYEGKAEAEANKATLDKIALKFEKAQADNDQISNTKIASYHLRIEVKEARLRVGFMSSKKKAELKSEIKDLVAKIKTERLHQAAEDAKVAKREGMIATHESDEQKFLNLETSHRNRRSMWLRFLKGGKGLHSVGDHNPFGWGDVQSEPGTPVPGSKPGSGVPPGIGGKPV